RTFGGRNLVLSLNYQKKLDFDRQLDFAARDAFSLGAAGSAIRRIFVDYAQEGGLATLSPAIGFEITNKLSVGITAHIWDSDIVPNNEWKTRNHFKLFTGGNGSGPPSIFSGTLGKGEFVENFSDYSAINFTIGALYKPNERWSVGVVYHSHYDAEVDYEKRTRTQFGVIPIPPVRIEHQRLKFEWPSATGVGVAYRFPNDKLTLSFDVTRREWDNFVKRENRLAPFPALVGGALPPAISVPGFLNSRRVSPITNLPLRLSPHDPTWSVRFGGEYVFVDEKKPIQNYLPSIRAGLFYDPEPASGAEDRFLLPPKRTGDPDDYYGVALGAGMLIKDRVNVDVAYQYRFGTNVKRDTFAGNFPFEIGFDSDVHQHFFYLSTVIYF
ncbi:MAG: outer membrane protein transport protein, partial [Candidatus Hydrogenedentota bacterium]